MGESRWCLTNKIYYSCFHCYKIIFPWQSSVNVITLNICFEPPPDKANKVACAPSEDSDQPGHPPSLIRVFTVRMKKAWALSYPFSAQRKLIRLGGCPGWSESSLGAQSFCWFCHEAAQIIFPWQSSVNVITLETYDIFIRVNRCVWYSNIRMTMFSYYCADWVTHHNPYLIHALCLK